MRTGPVIRRMAFALFASALALAAAIPAGSQPAGGISVTAMDIVLLPHLSTSTFTQYTMVTSARWSPPALRTEGAIYVRSCDRRKDNLPCKPSGSPQVFSFGYGGAVLHTSEAHGGLLTAAPGTDLSVTAHWRAYIPTPSGFIDGEADAPKKGLSIPTGIPLRFPDSAKLSFAEAGFYLYVSCASVTAFGTASAPGLPGPMVDLGRDSCAAASMTKDLAFDPVDPRFRAIAKPKVPPAPKASPGDGIGAASASAFNKLFAAQSKEIGYGRALVTSINRAQGANARKQVAWETKQMRAAGVYAKSVAAAFRDEAGRRATLAKTLADTDATLPDDAFTTFQDSLIRRGLPGAMAAALTKLGIPKTEQARIDGWLLATDPYFLGAAPTRAIADPRLIASLRKTAAALEAFSKKAARDPLHTGS